MKDTKKLSPAQRKIAGCVTELCDAAAFKWKQASDRAKSVRFTFRGVKYISLMTNMKMEIYTEDGEQIACRFH